MTDPADTQTARRARRTRVRGLGALAATITALLGAALPAAAQPVTAPATMSASMPATTIAATSDTPTGTPTDGTTAPATPTSPASPPVTVEPDEPHDPLTVLVGVAGLRWTDVNPSSSPHLWRMIGSKLRGVDQRPHRPPRHLPPRRLADALGRPPGVERDPAGGDRPRWRHAQRTATGHRRAADHRLPTAPLDRERQRRLPDDGPRLDRAHHRSREPAARRGSAGGARSGFRLERLLHDGDRRRGRRDPRRRHGSGRALRGLPRRRVGRRAQDVRRRRHRPGPAPRRDDRPQPRPRRAGRGPGTADRRPPRGLPRPGGRDRRHPGGPARPAGRHRLARLGERARLARLRVHPL